MNHSPWIAQLNRTRPVQPLDQNLETDVIIVGGGIAGVTTAYFLLTRTDKKVILLEAGKVAHGATGHNAGQISSYYEKNFSEMVEQFGIDKAKHAQKVIEEDARILLESIFSEVRLNTPRSEFMGYEACSNIDHVYTYLKEIKLKAESGLKTRHLIISKEWLDQNLIDDSYSQYFHVAKQQEILSLLETNNDMYIALNPFLSGCMNSALFTEELVGYLLSQFKDRFVLKEHTLVSKVILNKTDVLVEAGLNTVIGTQIVLCTNGFESIEIKNHSGDDINKYFHEEVEGVIGFMLAYKQQLTKAPFAASYANPNHSVNELYHYTTRRPFEDELNAKHNLICIGGPEQIIPDRGNYDYKKEYPLEVEDQIGTFILQTYEDGKTDPSYKWHGLMGYTKSGVRLIGTEKRNPLLLYNLGCNGVGILTSVYGGYRISQIIKGDTIEPTIFDPK